MAALWTSRGDSLVVHWLSAADSLVAITPLVTPPSADITDRPQPIQYDQPATFGSPDIMRSAILAASRAAGGQTRRTAAFMILIDTTGRALNVRMTTRSSLVRELDEAALRIYSGTQYHPAEDNGTPVLSWLLAELHWPGSDPARVPFP
jgi:hypothetical protein